MLLMSLFSAFLPVLAVLPEVLAVFLDVSFV